MGQWVSVEDVCDQYMCHILTLIFYTIEWCEFSVRKCQDSISLLSFQTIENAKSISVPVIAWHQVGAKPLAEVFGDLISGHMYVFPGGNEAHY